MIKYEDKIIKDPKICGGAPIIKGTRVRVKVILDNLAEGDRQISFPIPKGKGWLLIIDEINADQQI